MPGKMPWRVLAGCRWKHPLLQSQLLSSSRQLHGQQVTASLPTCAGPLAGHKGALVPSRLKHRHLQRALPERPT